MKKVLSLVLALAMVLSSMSFAFAGTFEDVTEANTAEAVDALAALGVVKGNPDGTFKPESSITRAEMAAMLVRVLGHSDLAAGSTSSFKDAKGKWYDGEVAIAQSLGLTNGYPDGTFKGENNVSYTEAITMIMRALGYNNKAVNSNREDAYNATSYKTAAARLGILKNITVGAAASNRGDVAIMLYNALDCQMVIVDKDGNPVGQTVVGAVKRTLLDSVATLDDNFQVTVAQLSKGHKVDLTPYLYQNVVAYKNDDGKVVFVRESNSKVFSGTMSKVTAGAITVKDTALTFPVTGVGAAATISGITVNVNTSDETLTVAELTAISNRVHSVKAIVTSQNAIEALVIEDVNKTIQVKNTYVAGKIRFEGIDLPTDDDGKFDPSQLKVVGDATSIEDIEIGDVLQACGNVKFYVTRDTVEGKITKTTSSKFTIDGTDYSKNPHILASDLEVGKEGTFFLDKDGKIAFVDGTSTVKENYGVITGLKSGQIVPGFSGYTSTPQVKMLTADGESKTYDVVVSVAGDTVGSAVTAPGFVPTISNGYLSLVPASGNITGSSFVVKYKLNSDGQITSITSAGLGGQVSMKASSAQFQTLAKDSTVIFTVDANTGKAAAKEVSQLGADTLNILPVVGPNGWELIVVTNDTSLSAEKTYATVTGYGTILNGNDKVFEVTARVDGVTKTYETVVGVTSSTVTGAMNKVMRLVLNTAGKITNIVAADYVTGVAEARTVVAVNSKVITVTHAGAQAYFALADDLVVYREGTASAGVASVSDLYDLDSLMKAGTTMVELYDDNNDGVVDVIFIRR